MTLMIFGFFLMPISKHSFIYHVARNLYSAKTKNDKFFQQENKDDKKLKQKSKKTKYKTRGQPMVNGENYRVIKISLFQSFKSYVFKILQKLCCCFSLCIDKNNRKLTKLFAKAESKIEKELDVIQILNTMKESRIL